MTARIVTVCVAASLPGTNYAQAEERPFPGLEALMSEADFARTGLDQLTPQQRAELNRWLAQRAHFKLEDADPAATDESSEASPRKSSKTAESKQGEPRLVARRLTRTERTAVEPVRTRIIGSFTGWTGSTLFALENGEYWKQRQTGRYYYKAESPEVELYKNRFGFWEIRLLATGKTVKVSRYEP